MSKLTLIEHKSFVRSLVYCLVVLTGLHIAVTVVFADSIMQSVSPPLAKLFYLDHENNIPAFFNMLLLLIVAAISYFIYVFSKKNGEPTFHWLFICLVFLFLAIDETISIHERVNLLIYNKGWRSDGFFKFLWIVPYVLFALVFLLVSFRLLKSLPRKTRNGFVLAGTVYVLGAAGFEMIGGKIIDTYGMDNVLYLTSATLEEVLEMTGLIIFIHYQLDYLDMKLGAR
ncbi:MAG: hypothetical protein KIT80_10175 [Chitinophagaceae bacterium]|nr:hypothetical protein [Chitinophagaceae bacterium]MCW5927267.1 hypothetical protein [Chitinophagaceae bacterium]